MITVPNVSEIPTPTPTHPNHKGNKKKEVGEKDDCKNDVTDQTCTIKSGQI